MRQETPRKRDTRHIRSHRLLKIYISLLSLHPIIQIQFQEQTHFTFLQNHSQLFFILYSNDVSKKHQELPN